MPPPRITTDTRTGKANGVHFIDTETRQDYVAKANVVVLAASTLESARLLLLSKLANSSGHVGHNLCEHVMGATIVGQMQGLVGASATADDARPGGFYIARYRNLRDRHPKFLRGYGFEGGSGRTMFPKYAMDTPGFGAAFKQEVRRNAGSYISMGGFGEVLARYKVPSISILFSRITGAFRRCAFTTASATTARKWWKTWRTRRRRCSRPPA